MNDLGGSAGRPAWADCSYLDGQFAQHWRTLGAVIDESSQRKCVVDVVQYVDADDPQKAAAPRIRIGETTLRPAEAERLINLAQQGLKIIRVAKH